MRAICARNIESRCLSLVEVGNSTQGQHSAKEPSMANVLTTRITTRALLSAPIRKPSFLTRLLRVHMESRQRRADALVAQYLAIHGTKLTDDAERDIERLLSRANR